MRYDRDVGATKTPHSGLFDRRNVFAAFDREGLSPREWSNGPGDAYTEHSHPYHKVLYCLAGSITFILPRSGERIALAPGDRLDIEPGTPHAAVVGPAGVECAEAERG